MKNRQDEIVGACCEGMKQLIDAWGLSLRLEIGKLIFNVNAEWGSGWDLEMSYCPYCGMKI